MVSAAICGRAGHAQQYLPEGIKVPMSRICCGRAVRDHRPLGRSGCLEHLIMLRFSDPLFDEVRTLDPPFAGLVFAKRLRRMTSIELGTGFQPPDLYRLESRLLNI